MDTVHVFTQGTMTAYLMLEQFQVMLESSSRGSSKRMLLLSNQLASFGSLQLLPQHPPYCTLLLHIMLQTQHPCSTAPVCLHQSLASSSLLFHGGFLVLIKPCSRPCRGMQASSHHLSATTDQVQVVKHTL